MGPCVKAEDIAYVLGAGPMNIRDVYISWAFLTLSGKYTDISNSIV